jgi:2-polyprenyl-3-methyl-5-hydroxy-6-metoxy-1,4-benzoquinol methylase
MWRAEITIMKGSGIARLPRPATTALTLGVVSNFADVEATWAARLGSLRNVVRQHLIRSQLRVHLDGITTVLDVGCGQGTQAIELAVAGRLVVGVDPSAALLALADEAAVRQGRSLLTLQGTVDDLQHLLPGKTFDLVCAHGLLMYVPSAQAAVELLRAQVAPGGLLSFTVRNGDASPTAQGSAATGVQPRPRSRRVPTPTSSARTRPPIGLTRRWPGAERSASRWKPGTAYACSPTESMRPSCRTPTPSRSA